MSATDPTTPALLSAARLSAIREVAADVSHAIATDGTLDDVTIEAVEPCLRDLLRHLDALQAPAPADGGEALGRMAWECAEAKWNGLMIYHWHELPEEVRAYYIAIGTALDAHGYARGVAAGEAAREALRGDVSRLESEAADFARWAHDALDRSGVAPSPADDPGVLPRMIRGFAAKDAEIARLTAELVEARNIASRVVTEALAEQAATRTEEVEAARREGAREERRLCLAWLQRNDLSRAGAQMVMSREDDDSRARGEGQGS